jgi:hypothetical protein
VITRKHSLGRVLRQLSPLSSVERIAEVYPTDGRVDVVVPADWLDKSRVDDSGYLLLKDSSGGERGVRLPAGAREVSEVETFGTLAVLRVSLAETQPEPTRETMIQARGRRHLGHRGAIGAA